MIIYIYLEIIKIRIGVCIKISKISRTENVNCNTHTQLFNFFTDKSSMYKILKTHCRKKIKKVTRLLFGDVCVHDGLVLLWWHSKEHRSSHVAEYIIQQIYHKGSEMYYFCKNTRFAEDRKINNICAATAA